MMRRPAHLTQENAARFQDESVVAVYDRRLPYPDEVFDVLVSLVTDTPRTALDIGTGTGDLARPLAPRLDRVDALDISAAMIARGQALPGGHQQNLRWIVGPAEDMELQPPYALITAGGSLHWMDWEVLLPRLARLRTEHGYLAMVFRSEIDAPWQAQLDTLISELSTIKNFEKYDLVEELERRHLFRAAGRHETAPVTRRQSVDDYVDSFHSRASLSRQAMPLADSQAFDERLRGLVERWSENGMLSLQTVGTVAWGVPMMSEVPALCRRPSTALHAAEEMAAVLARNESQPPMFMGGQAPEGHGLHQLHHPLLRIRGSPRPVAGTARRGRAPVPALPGRGRDRQGYLSTSALQ